MAYDVTVRLIRHEKTKANIDRKYIGITDESILPSKVRRMTHEPTIVYGSCLNRCKETAALYFPNAQYIADMRFNELNFGDFEMKTYEELKDLPIYRSWIDEPFFITPPNGENMFQFEERVLQAFSHVVKDEGNYTFVVHGGVIRVLLAKYVATIHQFSEAVANHHIEYCLQWDTMEQLKEGQPCISYSEAYLTEKEPM